MSRKKKISASSKSEPLPTSITMKLTDQELDELKAKWKLLPKFTYSSTGFVRTLVGPSPVLKSSEITGIWIDEVIDDETWKIGWEKYMKMKELDEFAQQLYDTTKSIYGASQLSKGVDNNVIQSFSPLMQIIMRGQRQRYDPYSDMTRMSEDVRNEWYQITKVTGDIRLKALADEIYYDVVQMSPNDSDLDWIEQVSANDDELEALTLKLRSLFRVKLSHSAIGSNIISLNDLKQKYAVVRDSGNPKPVSDQKKAESDFWSSIVNTFTVNDRTLFDG